MQNIKVDQIIFSPLDVESIKNFIRHLISQYEDKTNIQIQSSTLYLLYTQWAINNNIEVNSNSVSFGLQLKKTKIPFIKRREKKGIIIIFMIGDVKQKLEE